MLHLYSKGIRMTEPVPYWIKRAGIRSSEEGYPKVGKALAMHAEHEQDHHILYRNDFAKLQELWATRSSETLTFNPAFDTGNKAVRDYIMLHEDLINGPYPYCQVAVELEIEGVSETIGKQIVSHMTDVFGLECFEAMSFITEHAEIDVGHTRFNRGLLSELLKQENVNIEALTATGEKALSIFGAYIVESIEKGRREDLSEFEKTKESKRHGASKEDQDLRKKEMNASFSKLFDDANYDYDTKKNGELLKVIKAYLQSDRAYTSRFS